MRQQFQCHSCGGTYFDRDASGTTYQHACSPLPADENGISLPREDGRNENPVAIDRGNGFELQAEGLGVQCLTNPKLTEPEWITQMKIHAAKLAAKEN